MKLQLSLAGKRSPANTEARWPESLNSFDIFGYELHTINDRQDKLPIPLSRQEISIGTSRMQVESVLSDRSQIPSVFYVRVRTTASTTRGRDAAVRRKYEISKGVRLLEKQGHRVEPYMLHGKKWWQIDGHILITPEEINHIGEGRYSLAKLIKRSGITAFGCAPCIHHAFRFLVAASPPDTTRAGP